MKIGIRKFFRRNWKKCMCGITMFMGVLAISFTTLKPKASEIYDNGNDFYYVPVMTDYFYTESENWENLSFILSFRDNTGGYFAEYDYYSFNVNLLSSAPNNSILLFENILYSNLNLPSQAIFTNDNLPYFNAIEFRTDLLNGDDSPLSTYYNFTKGIVKFALFKINNDMFMIGFCIDVSSLYDDMNYYRTQATNLQNQNTNLQNQINDKNGYIELLQEQVNDYTLEVQRLQEDLANQESNLQTENIALRDRVTELESSIQSLNTQVQVAQDSGYALGYQAGFDAGNNSDNSLYNMVLAVVDAPISIFRSIFDFDILGVNISNLVFGLLSLLLILAIIKLLLFK